MAQELTWVVTRFRGPKVPEDWLGWFCFWKFISLEHRLKPGLPLGPNTKRLEGKHSPLRYTWDPGRPTQAGRASQYWQEGLPGVCSCSDLPRSTWAAVAPDPLHSATEEGQLPASLSLRAVCVSCALILFAFTSTLRREQFVDLVVRGHRAAVTSRNPGPLFTPYPLRSRRVCSWPLEEK